VKTGVEGHGAATLRDYLHIVRRQKWIILSAVALLPALALVYALHEKPVYRASSEVLLSVGTVSASQPSEGIASSAGVATQAQLAGVPAIASRAIDQARLGGMTPAAFLSACSVSSSTDTNILGFACQSHDAGLAVRMANAYSNAYRSYRRQLDTNSLENARREIAKRVQRLVAAGSSGPLYNTLVAREQQLQTTEALQTSNATVVKVAAAAGKISPRPKRDLTLGVILGIVIAGGLALLREALDTRVRTGQEIGERLGLPLLGRVPEPPKRLRAEDKLAMMVSPSGLHAEAFRVLRTNIEFSVLDSSIRSLMITSAVEQEGKSTTIANLAIALARGGQNVVLVDLDLRRPYMHKFFDLGDRPGITQVVLGHASLDDALVPIPIAPVKPSPASGRRYELAPPAGSNGHANGNGVGGRLSVMGAGPIPPDPGEFVASHALTSTLLHVQERAEVVLIDSPPLLRVGDSMGLSAKVDAVLLATRMEKVRRPMLAELHRLLGASPARVLGFIVTGAQAEEGYGYGSGYGYGYGSYYLPHGEELEVDEVAGVDVGREP
jgi:Mrp family chromosome partitioning ATPase